MMGMEWLIWVVVAVVVFRLVARPRRWRRDWLWDDDWLDVPYGETRLPGGGRGRGRHGRARLYRLERRRAAFEEAADRLEEASERLRSKARRGQPTADDRRPVKGSWAPSGSGRLSGSAPAAGSGSGNGSGSGVPARKAAETPLAALQRRFAEGEITMEQYERELDKLYGLN